MLVYALIHFTIYTSKTPAKRSGRMQAFFLWICFFVNVLFILIKGPKFLKVKPLWLAVVIASAVAVSLIPVFYGCMFVNRYLQKKANDYQSSTSTKSSRISSMISAKLGLDDDSTKTDVVRPSIQKFTWRAQEEEKEESKLEVAFPEKTDAEQDQENQMLQEKALSEKYFVPLLIVSAMSVACAHGGNDVGNAIGPLSAIVMVFDNGTVSAKPDIPIWAIIYGSLGFVLGIFTMGRLTIKTVGTKITVLTPSKSFATQMGGAIAVLGSSYLGLPVSTSHCLVGSVIGIGLFEKLMKTGTLNLMVLSRIFLAWGITIPLAMVIASAIFLPFKHLFE